MFDEIIDEIIGIEGGHSNHKNDSGGDTMYGITIGVARSFGFKGPMRMLPLSLAKQIYREKYWNPLKLDEISNISPSLVKELLDTGINQGVKTAAGYLQQSLNAFNRRGAEYDDLKIDYSIGPATIKALRAFIAKRRGAGEIVMLRTLNCLQGARYVKLSQERPKDEDFVYGWMLNRVVI